MDARGRLICFLRDEPLMQTRKIIKSICNLGVENDVDVRN